MRIISASLSGYTTGGECRVITANRTKGGLALARARHMSIKELTSYAKGRNVHISCEYLDMVTGEVELPPVSDIKSINALTKNKLQDNVRDDIGYTFIRQEPVETAPQAQSTQISVMKQYTVFGVPDDFIPSIIPAKLQSKASIITLDPFSMIAISKRVNSKELVCHAYADEDRLVLTFSIGDKQVYFRVTAIPETLNSKDDLINFYYDTINLTYLYVRQSRQIPITVVLLSGLLYNEKSLADSVETLTGVRITDLDHTSIIKNCSEEQFHEYLLPIGAALVNNDVNFISVSFQEDLAYRDILTKLNMAFAVVLAVMVVLAGKYFVEYQSKKSNLDRQVTMLNGRLNSLETYIGDESSKNSLFYIDNYISLLHRRELTPASLMQPTQDLIIRDTYTSLIYKNRPQHA
jgi:hypothetical protein